MSEIALGKKVCLMASELGHRLFRMNTGLAWVGESLKFSKPMKIEVMPGDVLIRKARPFHSGFIGMSDYGGWTKDGRTLWCEIKTPIGKIKPEQISFIDAVNKAGGIAGIVRDEESAFDLLS